MIEKYNLKIVNDKGLQTVIDALHNGYIKNDGLKISCIYTKYSDTQIIESILPDNKKYDIEKIKYILIGINAALKTYTQLYVIDDSGEIIKTLIG